jgi:hypothetical protein
MPHKLLSAYLQEIEQTIRTLENVYVEHYEEEILAFDRVNLRIRARFLNGYLLELNEAVILEGRHLKSLGYRYHFQDGQNKIVFRYDDTPHFPNIESFPHHKHLRDTVMASEKPSIIYVIQEAEQCVQQSTYKKDGFDVPDCLDLI